MFFAIDLVRVSTETSTNSAAYIYSCNLSVAMPVTVDSVKTVSAKAAPSLVMSISALPAAMAAAETAAKAAAIAPATALHTPPSASILLPDSSACLPASSISSPILSADFLVSSISLPVRLRASVFCRSSRSIPLSSAVALFSCICHACVLLSFSPKDADALARAARSTSILLFCASMDFCRVSFLTVNASIDWSFFAN